MEPTNREKAKPVGYIDAIYADTLRKCRKKKCLSLTQASKQIGCSVRSLRRLENRWDISLRFNCIIKMMNLYDIRIEPPYYPDVFNIEDYRIASKSEQQINIIYAVQSLSKADIQAVDEMIKILKNNHKNKEPADSESQMKLIGEITTLPREDVEIINALVTRMKKLRENRKKE